MHTLGHPGEITHIITAHMCVTMNAVVLDDPGAVLRTEASISLGREDGVSPRADQGIETAVEQRVLLEVHTEFPGPRLPAQQKPLSEVIVLRLAVHPQLFLLRQPVCDIHLRRK